MFNFKVLILREIAIQLFPLFLSFKLSVSRVTLDFLLGANGFKRKGGKRRNLIRCHLFHILQIVTVSRNVNNHDISMETEIAL